MISIQTQKILLLLYDKNKPIKFNTQNFITNYRGFKRTMSKLVEAKLIIRWYEKMNGDTHVNAYYRLSLLGIDFTEKLKELNLDGDERI